MHGTPLLQFGATGQALMPVGIPEQHFRASKLPIYEQDWEKVGMIEMTRVWERLYVGGRLDAEHLFKLNPFGIATVVSLCEDEIIRRHSGINYVHVPVVDATRIGVGQFDTIIDAIGENIRWGTVLLHCGSGASRAPILAAAWMHVVGYKNIDGALEEIAELRSIVAPSEVLLSSVRKHLK